MDREGSPPADTATGQYQVNVDPNRLRNYGLSIPRVVEAVRGGKVETAGRLIEFGGTESMVRGRRRRGVGDHRDAQGENAVDVIGGATPLIVVNTGVSHGFERLDDAAQGADRHADDPDPPAGRVGVTGRLRW